MNWLKDIGQYAQILFNFGLSVLAAILLGFFIDNYFRTNPFFTIAGTIIGISVAFYQLYVYILKNK